MRILRGLLVTASLLAVTFAGCTDDPAAIADLAPSVEAPTLLEDLGAEAASAFDRNQSAVLVDADTVSETFTGSFTTADVCTGPCNDDLVRHRHDLETRVPVGVRSHIEVVVETSAPDAALEVRIFTPDGETGVGALISEGTQTVDLRFVRITPGPVFLQVVYQTPSATSPRVDYTLDVTVTPDVRSVAPGAPVALDLDPGAEVTLLNELDAVRMAPVVLYAPDNSVYGRYTVPLNGTQVRLPDDAPSGTYVLVAGPGTKGLHLLAADAVVPRVLDLALVASDRVAFATEPGGAARADGELRVEAPLLHGRIVVETRPGSLANNGGSEPTTASMDAVVEGPEGILIEDTVPAPFSCVLCPFPLQDVVRSDYGGHASGTYTWSAAGDVGPEADAWFEAVVWQR